MNYIEPSNRKKRLYIGTLGCQMNFYDSTQIELSFKSLGYDSANSIDNADIILLNTCSIREKACQKAFSFLGRLRNFKKKKQSVIIGVCGCLAQQDGYKIIRRMPYIDFVAGVNTIYRLPAIVEKIENQRCRIVDIEFDPPISEPLWETPPRGRKNVSEFVTVMRGCDNFCTYCVVPYVRGREISRKPEHIIDEIDMLVSGGVKEITLLGQNVNSYGKKEGNFTFTKLIRLINKIDGLERIRFTTSNPKDLGEDLMEAFVKFDKLCPHIHLPVQSGSDAVLKKMNRKYTAELYIEKIEKLRSIRPDIAITSDFIVGFCTETETDFNMTLDLIQKIRFDGIFAFIYSPRPNTSAEKLEDTVSLSEKKERLRRLLESQEYYTKQKNKSLAGTEQKVLVEGRSKRAFYRNQKKEWTGRTDTNKIVNFIQSENKNLTTDDLKGKIVDIKIERGLSHSLWGRLDL